MKKTLYMGLFILVLIVWTADIASGKKNLANTSQLGSLLVFPKVKVGENEDTIIQITNTSSRGVKLKCYWISAEFDNVNGGSCSGRGFIFNTTPNQPLWFSAKTGRGMQSLVNPIFVPAFEGPVGELKCWAVNSKTIQQIKHDYLKGEATIIDFVHRYSARYNAWSFQANYAKFRQVVGVPGELILSGKGPDPSYDACPKYLWFDFFAKGATFNNDINPELIMDDNDVTIIPCIQDLRQDGPPTLTKLEFDIYDENEVKYGGIYDCLYCYYNKLLGDLDDLFTNAFPGGLQTDAGSLRIWGAAHPFCDDEEQGLYSTDAGLLGVHLSRFLFGPYTETDVRISATTPWAEGCLPNGVIRYDLDENL